MHDVSGFSDFCKESESDEKASKPLKSPIILSPAMTNTSVLHAWAHTHAPTDAFLSCNTGIIASTFLFCFLK